MGQAGAPEEAQEILKEPDVTVTNQSDKEVNRDKLLKLNDEVRNILTKQGPEQQGVSSDAFAIHA